MRIIQVISAFQLGGAETAVRNLAVGLARAGHSVSVASVRRPAALSDPVGAGIKGKLLEAGVEVHDLGIGMKTLDTCLSPMRLLHLQKKWQADILHSHSDIPDFTVSILARFMRDLRIARTIHNTQLWATHNSLGHFTEAGLTRDMIIYTNRDTLDSYETLRQRYSLASSPFKANIKYGFDLDNTDNTYDRTHLVRRYHADSSKWQFCFAGRLTHQKGVDVLLKAIAALPRDYLLRLQLHVFGDGEEKDMISAFIKDHELPVLLHTPEESVHRLFPAFDCVILTSRYEGSPMVVIESLCQGVPIIVTSVCGLREAVPNWWPLCAPSENWHALASLIRDVMDGTSDLKSLARRGREWAINEHSLSKVVALHEDAYRRLIQSSASGVTEVPDHAALS